MVEDICYNNAKNYFKFWYYEKVRIVDGFGNHGWFYGL
jgi:hypothetical protein